MSCPIRNPAIHCRSCNRLYFPGHGTQRCCSTTCESVLTNRIRIAITAAKTRRATNGAT